MTQKRLPGSYEIRTTLYKAIIMPDLKHPAPRLSSFCFQCENFKRGGGGPGINRPPIKVIFTQVFIYDRLAIAWNFHVGLFCLKWIRMFLLEERNFEFLILSSHVISSYIVFCLQRSLRMDFNSRRRFALIFGYSIFRSPNVSRMIWETINRAFSLSSVGTTCQRACPV